MGNSPETEKDPQTEDGRPESSRWQAAPGSLHAADAAPRHDAGVFTADLDTADAAALRRELDRELDDSPPARWDADPAEARRSVLRLVLALAEFLRALMERQAVRRMEEGSLDDEEVEAVGLALMRLEETLHDLARQFDLSPDDLNIDLGPLGRLL